MTPDELKRHPSVIRLYQSKVPRLRKERGEWIGLCPIHNEKTPSFKVKDKDGVLLWKCFGCSDGGSIIDLVMKVDGSNLPSAIRTVEEFCTGTWSDKAKKVDSAFASVGAEEKPKKLVSYRLLDWEPYEKALDESSVAKAWLANRGIDLATAKSLHWGYRESTKKFCEDDCAESGWIAFPYIEDGIVKGIKYRSIVKKSFVCQPHMQIGLYNRDCIDPKEPLFVVEGEVDCATLVQAGYKAVSLPSASFNITPQLKDVLMKAPVVYLAGDTDAAGAGAMDKLWRGLDRTYKLEWPSGMKDANQTLNDYPGPSFKSTVEDMIAKGMDTPIPHIYSLQGAMLSQDRTKLVDNPARLHMPWPEVDRMATLLPGSVMVLFSTNTKMAKTTLLMNFTLYGARNYGEVVLNYSAELTPEEIGSMVNAHVLRKDRNHLTATDGRDAVAKLTGVKYYIGRDPTLTTVDQVLDLMEAGVKRLGATLVCLDTIHFFTNGDDAIQQQAAAMQRFKLMATKYQFKGVVVAQPRKAKSADKGKIVHLVDLKGSEALGSSADAVFAQHRDYVKTKTTASTEEYEPRTEIHLLAARSRGDGGVMAELFFLGKLATFEPLGAITTAVPAGLDFGGKDDPDIVDSMGLRGSHSDLAVGGGSDLADSGQFGELNPESGQISESFPEPETLNS